MKIYCERTKRNFTNYEYTGVCFSADSLEICPYCRESPWHPKFFETHKKITESIKNYGHKFQESAFTH